MRPATGSGSLGEEFLDKAYLADSIAGTVRTFGYVLWFVALGLAA
jgi:hypothetical protein